MKKPYSVGEFNRETCPFGSMGLSLAAMGAVCLFPHMGIRYKYTIPNFAQLVVRGKDDRRVCQV